MHTSLIQNISLGSPVGYAVRTVFSTIWLNPNKVRTTYPTVLSIIEGLPPYLFLIKWKAVN